MVCALSFREDAMLVQVRVRQLFQEFLVLFWWKCLPPKILPVWSFFRLFWSLINFSSICDAEIPGRLSSEKSTSLSRFEPEMVAGGLLVTIFSIRPSWGPGVMLPPSLFQLLMTSWVRFKMREGARVWQTVLLLPGCQFNELVIFKYHFPLYQYCSHYYVRADIEQTQIWWVIGLGSLGFGIWEPSIRVRPSFQLSVHPTVSLSVGLLRTIWNK